MPSNFKALAGASGGEPTDANFKNVTLLLHGDGSNGAQNNTFLDSSTNNFTITRNGNTTQGSFSPYGSNWSNYFDGASTLTFSQINMAGDFTIESWVYYTGTGDGTVLGALPPNHQSLRRLSGKHYFYREGVSVSGTIDLPVNQWVHLAATRSGSTVRIFTNGVLDGSVTVTGTFSLNCLGGINTTTDRLTGYASNVRIINGTALYTSTFTPSTTPLTAITNTSLLTCQSNRFRDASTNNFTITRNGDVKVTNFAPFAPSAAYSTTTNGGSGYFDGTGDTLSIAYNSALNVSGTFTVEAWIYQTSRPASSSIINRSGIDFAQFSSFELTVEANGTVNFIQGSGTGTSGSQTTLNSATAIPLNAWVHIAGVRNGSTNKLYINGAEVASGASGSNDGNTSSSVFIGARAASSQLFTGFISNARLVKGTAVYTAAFTPPTAPVTAIANTSLLLNATNAAIFDNSMKNDLETVGNAQISTSVKKFGTGSMAFDGTGDYISIPSNNEITLGSGDFTIEFWVYLNSTSGVQILYDQRSGAGAYPVIYMDSTTIRYFVSGADRITGAALSVSTWYHVAVARSGTSTKLFVNGTQSGSTYTDTTNYLAAPLFLGADKGPSAFMNGYIDDLRITKGVARYTANFTAPTAPFPNK